MTSVDKSSSQRPVSNPPQTSKTSEASGGFDSKRRFRDGKDQNPLAREGSWASRAVFYLSLPAALACAAWISAGRALFGAAGDLTFIFTISFGLPLFLILALAHFFSAKELKLQERGFKAGLPPVTALVLVSGWAIAALFGFLIPDRLDGATVSAAAQVLGPDVIGLSAAFANTSGILTFSFAIASLLISIADYRRAKALLQGLDDATREELERQDSIYDFLD